MISIVGLGNAASAIAENFSATANYNVFVMNDKVPRTSKYKFKLKSYDKPEEYENNIRVGYLECYCQNNVEDIV